MRSARSLRVVSMLDDSRCFSSLVSHSSAAGHPTSANAARSSANAAGRVVAWLMQGPIAAAIRAEDPDLLTWKGKPRASMLFSAETLSLELSK